MIFDLYDEIKEDYYEAKDSMELSDEKYEELRTRFEELGLEIPELKEIHPEKTTAYVFTDPECEDADIIIVEDDGNRQSYVQKIEEGVEEYYSHSVFHSEITGLWPKDLILMLADESNIPIVTYYEGADMANIRWLRKICD